MRKICIYIYSPKRDCGSSFISNAVLFSYSVQAHFVQGSTVECRGHSIHARTTGYLSFLDVSMYLNGLVRVKQYRYLESWVRPSHPNLHFRHFLITQYIELLQS